MLTYTEHVSMYSYVCINLSLSVSTQIFAHAFNVQAQISMLQCMQAQPHKPRKYHTAPSPTMNLHGMIHLRGGGGK